MTTFIDPKTIRRNGNFAQIWVLADFKDLQQSPSSAPFLSVKSQQEFDCVEERSRIVAMIRYSSNMGLGKVVWNSDQPDMDWTTMATGSINRLLFTLACGEVGRVRTLQKWLF
jgi:hypothetical protein